MGLFDDFEAYLNWHNRMFKNGLVRAVERLTKKLKRKTSRRKKTAKK